jgi:DNA-binding response OmpR family regulator
MAATVLLIGGSRVGETAHRSALEKHYDVRVAPSGKQGLTLAKAHPPRAVILDAISLGTLGERICRSLNVGLPGVPLIHLVPEGTRPMQSCGEVVLKHPITSRRLLNVLQRTIQEDAEEVIDCGPFVMNVTRRILVAHGKETQLTPKLSLLLEMFLRNPGQTIDRKRIMQHVWETDYLGDTRTLDVHIRWMRDVLEGKGGQPRYLKTVRGVGYCLDVTEVESVATV